MTNAPEMTHQPATSTPDLPAPLASVATGALGLAPGWASDCGRVVLYHADCRDVLPTLARADAIITDPPYGISFAAQPTTGGRKRGQKAETWDDETPTDVVLSLPALAPLCVIWGGNYYPLPPTRCWLVWNKPERGLTMADAEIAWVSRDGNIRVFDSSRNPDGKRDHPTQKPLELMTWCIAQFPHAKTVIDPFAGSGTTGRAAKDMGRKCVLIEREQKYCDVIVRRLAQEVLPFT